MPTFLEDRNTVRQAIGRSTGHMIGRRTYTATEASTAHVRMEDLLLRTAQFGEGLNLYVATGGGLGQARTVVSTAAFVQGTGSIVYPHVDFTTAPSSNAAIELWRGVEAPVVNGFIDDAIRNVARRYLQHKEDYSIHLGDPLRHWGSFERWPDGNTSAPDGWSLSSNGSESVQKGTSIARVYSGRAVAEVTNQAATAAYLESDNLFKFPMKVGEQLTVKAKVSTALAGRVFLSVNDGVATHTGGLHDGSGDWDGDGDAPISVTFTVSNAATQILVRLNTNAGDAINVRWGKVWIEGAGPVYAFELPADIDPATAADETAFATISEVWAESTTSPGVYNTRIPNEFWYIDSDSSTRRIVFIKGLIDQYVTAGREIRIVGQRPARLPTADTQNLEVDPEYVRIHCAYSILDSMPWDDMDRSKRDRLQRESAAKLADITTSVYPDSVVVEV